MDIQNGRNKNSLNDILLTELSTSYDLPDLIGCIAPGKVILVNLNDQMLEPASTELINQELAFPRSVYSLKDSPENLKVVSQYENINSIIDWCFE